VLAGRLSVSVAEELLPLDGLRKEVLATEAAEAGWDRRQLRLAMNGDGLRSTKTRASVLRRTRDLRAGLRTVRAADLSEAERRELRLLFRELALLAKAPADRRKAVLPPLPARARSAAAR
jgi:hypothetical protein